MAFREVAGPRRQRVMRAQLEGKGIALQRLGAVRQQEGHLRLAHSLGEMVEVVAVRQEGAELPVMGGGEAQGVSLGDGPQHLTGGGDPLHGVGATQDLVHHAEKGRGALRGIQNTL